MRYGSQFRRRLRLLEDSTTAPPDQLRELQWWNLKFMLYHAYEHVPFYRKRFGEMMMHPGDIKSMDDWKASAFPVLTRGELVENRHELLAQNLCWENTHRHTFLKSSGSTGEPVQIVADKRIYEDEAAFVERAYRANGATLYFGKTVWLRRWLPNVEQGDPLWYYDEEQQRLYMSAYHLRRENVDGYLEAIRKAKAETLVAYPSAAYILACLVGERYGKADLGKIRHIQTSSEQLLPGWRAKISEVFPATVSDHYGQIEKVCLHYRCPGAAGYHDSVEYGLTELLPDGNIVATGFLNPLMPLIRYQTGDFGTIVNRPWAGDACAYCGATLPSTLWSIDGRTDDILFGEDGGMIPAVNFYTMFYKIKGVQMFQLTQMDARTIVARIVPSQEYGGETERAILRGLRERLGAMDFLYMLTDQIERDERTGKIRCVRRRQ